jgi:small-conductance mechanosensitive channel/CRP-like cAMP-binding protein
MLAFEPSPSGQAAHWLATNWVIPLLFGGVVLVAWLVNRYAPSRRRRLRRVVIVFGIFLLCFGAALLLQAFGVAEWAFRLRVASQLFEAFTLINLAALVAFDLALPAVRVNIVSITTDILIGLAYIVATLGVLAGAGLNLTSIVATSAIVSGILALSLQATLGNILGGVALQLDGSIHVGDWVQLENGRQGKVREIRWRHTVVETRDWSTIIVPNSALLGGNIMILGKRDGLPVPHRMWVYFFVDYRYAPARVCRIVEEALRSAHIERVANDPPPNCICMDLGREGADSFARYAVRYMLTDLAVDDPTSSAIRARIHAALRRAQIPLARPARTIFMTPEDEQTDKRREERHHSKRLTAIQSIDLFRDLKADEKAFLADRLHYAPFTAGETITKQGAIAHYLYVLARGRAEIVTDFDGKRTVVTTLSSPSFFGEMGLMTGEPRLASVIALEDVECFRLEKEGFQKIIEARPEIAEGMSEKIAKRRVELIAAREQLDEKAKRAREASEQERILGRIQDFFGLGEQQRRTRY